MEKIEVLKHTLMEMATMTDAEFELSRTFWKPKQFQKGEFYNQHRQVCKQLGFIFEGVFRTYYYDDQAQQEKNVFFFSKHQVVVSYQSFIAQAPCNYFTQSMTQSEVLSIHYDHLQELYRKSHGWERLGRLLAEMAFSFSMSRTESFLFQTPEQRYLE